MSATQTTPVRVDFLTRLPREVVILTLSYNYQLHAHIFSHLDTRTLARIGGVCVNWRRFTEIDAVWREAAKRSRELPDIDYQTSIYAPIHSASRLKAVCVRQMCIDRNWRNDGQVIDRVTHQLGGE
jgi:hypothetical protein